LTSDRRKEKEKMPTTETKPHLTYKSVDTLLVAYIRLLGQHEEIPRHFQELKSKVGELIVGNPICLYDRTADDIPEAHYLEVCYPISQPVEDGEVKTKTLPACQVMTATFPVASDAPWGPAAWWSELGGYARANYLTIDEDALRECRYTDNGIEMSEIQLVLQFPRWVEGLSQGLKRYGDDGLSQQIMAGGDLLEPIAPIEERLAWVEQAMEKIDQTIPDVHQRGLIIQGCAHRFPAVRIEKMRALYEELGNVDALIEWIQQDKIANGGTSWYGNPVREGNIIYDIKDPASSNEYEQAQTNTEKRMARCFCPIVRAAIKSNRKISATFCNCSAGYTAQFWQSVLQQPLRIEVLETVLKGDEVCKFAIHLPELVE
jgi:effector-binding domain-containing protein